MHVILTHEQADFDAMGALLGACLMDPRTLPVLPRRMNRNLRTFISLYGGELPFVEARDLPPRPINQVTLVDTQSLVTLRGMTTAAAVRVIDHHQAREDLPETWKVQVDPVGACTTLFVENLQEKTHRLSPIEATLLLLGIYEDTGALTYVSTTARDMRAAAFLLDSGASLRILSEYLNPPLTHDQRTVFDRLVAAAETHYLQGQKVLVAHTSAPDLIEELSSIAHKMRDLLEPDGLFILVRTNEGIRLVARSTTDRIDVSKIAARFNGGGHARAAAALVRADTLAGENEDEQLESAYRALVTMLPAYISPPITVGQIMSRGPLVLSPEISAQEAALLMQRYGYEGYPVVKNDRILGLLTRRAVDRALAHKLKVTAESLMEAGEVYVSPRDSVEHLQRLMNSSGWGQIPVVAPETGEIIGIVTRTDLLKTLNGSAGSLPGGLNFAARLDAAIPTARLALLKLIAARAHTHRQAVYIVGGFVRDLLLGHSGMDFDIVVEGDAIALAQTMAGAMGGRVVAHSRFGTAKWWIADVRSALAARLSTSDQLSAEDLPQSIDLISARTEFYDYPTALPTVERSSIKLDLHRRDFTINTMALRLDGKYYGDLYDYWGGLNDLQRGLVRVLHSLSFIDDPTRMLRAVRFEQRFQFQIEARTLQLMEEARQMLKQVSGDRLRHELNLIFAEGHPGATLARLEELNLLRSIHPDLFWRSDLDQPIETVLHTPLDEAWDLPTDDSEVQLRRTLAYILWLGRLPEEKIEQIDVLLRFPAAVRSALVSASRLWRDLPELINAPPSQITARLENLPPEVLFAFYHLGLPDEMRSLIHRFIYEWKSIRAHTDGRTLLAMDLKPGPVFATLLNRLRSAWLDGQVSTYEEERRLLETLINDHLKNETFTQTGTSS